MRRRREEREVLLNENCATSVFSFRRYLRCENRRGLKFATYDRSRFPFVRCSARKWDQAGRDKAGVTPLIHAAPALTYLRSGGTIAATASMTIDAGSRR